MDLLGFTRLEVPGYEADDVLATLAKKAEKEGYEVRILTADRDLYQLVSDRVAVLHPEGHLITPEWLWEKYGLRPEQWVDFRALVGDPSDNLPGVKGIGEKTALKLLKEWGSLENLLKNLDRVKPENVREKIKAHLEDLRLSLELSRVRTDLPLEVDLAQGREPDREGLRAFLERLEFGSLLHEFGLLEAPAPLEEAPWPPPEGAFVGFVLSRPEPMWAELKALAACRDGRVHRAADPLAGLKDLKEVRGLLAKDLAVLASREGLDLVPGDDPMLLAYLLDPSNTTPEGWRGATGGSGRRTPPTGPSSRRGSIGTSLSASRRRSSFGSTTRWKSPSPGSWPTWRPPGYGWTWPTFRPFPWSLRRRSAASEEEVFRLAGHPFNLNSRDQLERVLFDELRLPALGKTQKTGKRSTSAAVLEALREAHPIVEKILQHRELTKLKNTYVDPLPSLVHPRTGRLHTRFNQTATATGRLSSSDPNLQNIPVRTPLGQRIRRAFVAEAGWALVALDYSQIELRVLAHLSGDENLIRVFQEGKDIHTQTASWMFGVPPEAVDPLMRRAAKTVNFGVLYGMSAHRLSQELAIPYEEAVAFIERYFQSFPKVRAWIEKTLEEGRKRGYVETLFGRRRYVPDLNARVKSVREAAERMAFNMPVQGTAADLMKLAMVKLFPRLREMGARMLLQVHDELLLEAPQARAEEVAALAKEAMEKAYPLAVPLEVEVGMGEDWLSAKG